MSLKHFLLASAASIFLFTTALPAIAAPVRDIVLVHGAFQRVGMEAGV
jgi:hypothetical protein